MWRRLVVSYGVVISFSLLALSVFLYGAVYVHLLGQQRSAQLLQAQIVATGLGRLEQEDRIGSLAALAGQLPGRTLLVNTQGDVTYDSFYDTNLPKQLVHYPEVRSALQGQPAADPYHGGSIWALHTAVPLWQGRQVVGALVYVQGLSGLRELLDRLFWALAIGNGLVLLLTVVMSSIVAARLTRPIELLDVSVQRLAKGEPHQPVQVAAGGDELATLAKNFNSMADKLHRLEQQRRQFLSDAAHELRTPLASLQALLEPLAEGPPQSPERYQEFLSDGLGEVQRLHSLVEDLLQVNRLEGTLHLDQRRFNISELVGSVVRLLSSVASTKGVEIRHVTPTTGLQIMGDAEKLKQVFVNLLDNAVKHSPIGAVVVVEEGRQQGVYQVSIADQGAGIPEEDLPHIFERFYRGDKARVRDTGGSGLGLAIALRIAQLHEGSIDVHSEVGKGSSFVVNLPINRLGGDKHV